MRRQLVLTNESARHPFRQSLPRHLTKEESPRTSYREPLTDRGLFLLTFVSAFMAFSVFLG